MNDPTNAPSIAVWLTTPNVAAAEIARDLGYDAVVLDIEHGAFDLGTLYAFVPFLKALGFTVTGKVLEPQRGPIQQALDVGADAVVIPHIEGAAHAKAITAFAKFPPLGDRSFAGGRTAGFGGFDDEWISVQDTSTRCYPMVEDAGAFAEIDEILALPSVDGVFVGPSDLSMRQARGAYKRSPEDFADLVTVATAAQRAGKPWILPAWSDDEKQIALRHGASQIVATMEFSALASGLAEARRRVGDLAATIHRGG